MGKTGGGKGTNQYGVKGVSQASRQDAAVLDGLAVDAGEPIPFGTPAEVRVAYGVDPDGGYLYEWEPTRVVRDYPGHDVLEIERVDANGHPFATRVRREDVRGVAQLASDVDSGTDRTSWIVESGSGEWLAEYDDEAEARLDAQERGERLVRRVETDGEELVEDQLVDDFGVPEEHDGPALDPPSESPLDRAIIAHREHPTTENRAKVDELLHAHVESFYRRQTAEFIARTR